MSQFSVLRPHCPGKVNSEAKDMENCQYTSLQIIQQLKNTFRIIAFRQSAQYLRSKLRTYVRNLRFHQDRSGEPDVLMGQSIVLSEIKAEVPFAE